MRTKQPLLAMIAITVALEKAFYETPIQTEGKTQELIHPKMLEFFTQHLGESAKDMTPVTALINTGIKLFKEEGDMPFSDTPDPLTDQEAVDLLIAAFKLKGVHKLAAYFKDPFFTEVELKEFPDHFFKYLTLSFMADVAESFKKNMTNYGFMVEDRAICDCRACQENLDRARRHRSRIIHERERGEDDELSMLEQIFGNALGQELYRDLKGNDTSSKDNYDIN